MSTETKKIAELILKEAKGTKVLNNKERIELYKLLERLEMDTQASRKKIIERLSETNIINIFEDSYFDIMLFDVSRDKVYLFENNSVGFSQALSASGSGDTIHVPPGTISGNHTIPSGVTVICDWNKTVFTGTITNNGRNVGGILPGHGTDILVADSGADEVFTMSSPAANPCGMHFYSRNGSNFQGWWIGKDPSGNEDFDINWDGTYGTMTEACLRIDSATRQWTIGAAAPLAARAGAKVIVVDGELNIQDNIDAGLVINGKIGETGGTRIAYIDFYLNNGLSGNIACINGTMYINSTVANGINLCDGGGSVTIDMTQTGGGNKFEVAGNIMATGTVKTNSTGTLSIAAGNTLTYPFVNRETFTRTWTTNGSTDQVVSASATVTSDNASAARYPVSIIGTTTTAGATNFGSTSLFTGIAGNANMDAAITVIEAVGARGRVTVNNASSITTTACGTKGMISWAGAGEITTANCVQAYVYGAAKGTTLALFSGVFDTFSVTSLTNLYGLYIPALSGASTINRAIHTAGGDHYFGGAVQVIGAMTATGLVYTNTTGVVDVAAGITANIDAATTITTALTNNGGAGVLTWPAGGATLTIAGTGTAVTGSGTANYLSKWATANTQGNSLIQDDGTTIGINTAPASSIFINISKTWGDAALRYGLNLDTRNTAGDCTGVNVTARNRDYTGNYVTGLTMVAHVWAVSSNAAAAAEAVGFQGRIYVSAAAGKTASIGWGKAVQAISPLFGVAGGTETITNNAGCYIGNQGAAGVTNAYGIYIVSQSGAVTLNYAIYTNAGNITFNAGLADDADFLLNGTTYALIQTDANVDELYLCNNAAAKLSFFAATPIVRPTALTAQLTTLTYTAPGTPDYAIQDFVDVSLGAGWAFANHDEANSVLKAIANLQIRLDELEDKLGSTAGLGLITH